MDVPAKEVDSGSEDSVCILFATEICPPYHTFRSPRIYQFIFKGFNKDVNYASTLPGGTRLILSEYPTS